jgi:hypothetical protein
MNPQRQAHVTGIPQADGAGNDPSDEQGIGSAQAGYATPENGPFECSNCVHFDGQASCDNSQVISDPEVQGKVDPEGCCNFFRPSGNENQQEEQGETETGAIPGAGEQV